MPKQKHHLRLGVKSLGVKGLGAKGPDLCPDLPIQTKNGLQLNVTSLGLFPSL